MNKSFSDKLKAGWSKEQLMKYYCLSEERYNKTIHCLEDIRGRGAPGAPGYRPRTTLFYMAGHSPSVRN